MDHPLLFRHHHAHQIARQGIDACFIFVRYVNISCINYIKYLFFIYRFSEAIVPLVLFHQFDVLQELTARQRGYPRHHALTLVLSGIATEFVFYKRVRFCIRSYRYRFVHAIPVVKSLIYYHVLCCYLHFYQNILSYGF